MSMIIEPFILYIYYKPLNGMVYDKLLRNGEL